MLIEQTVPYLHIQQRQCSMGIAFLATREKVQCKLSCLLCFGPHQLLRKIPGSLASSLALCSILQLTLSAVKCCEGSVQWVYQRFFH